MSKQKKDAKNEKRSEPLDELEQTNAAPQPASHTAGSEVSSTGPSMSDLEQELLQPKSEEPLFDADTLAALSNLAEMESSFLTDPAAEENDDDTANSSPQQVIEANEDEALGLLEPEPLASEDETENSVAEVADFSSQQIVADEDGETPISAPPRPIAGEDDAENGVAETADSAPEPVIEPEEAGNDVEDTSDDRPDWLSDDLDLYGFADELLEDDVPVLSEEELTQLLDEAAEELLDSASDSALDEMSSNILDDVTDEVFDVLFEDEEETNAQGRSQVGEPALGGEPLTREPLDHEPLDHEPLDHEPLADKPLVDEADVATQEEEALPPPEPDSEIIPQDVNNDDDKTLLVASEAAEQDQELSAELKEDSDISEDAELLEALTALGNLDDEIVSAEEATLDEEEADALEALATLATMADDEIETATAETTLTDNPVDAEPLTNEMVEALEALSALEETSETENVDYLEALIATIDEEVEAVYGAGAMADLTVEQPADTRYNLQQYVVFVLSGSIYATPASHVREVAQLASVTRIPNVPNWLLGVTNLRGDVLSLIGLRAFLGLNNGQQNSFILNDNQVMVVHSEKHASSITTGLVVDEIQDIRYLDVDKIDDLAAPIDDQIAPYLQGVYEENGRLLTVLDLEKLLLAPEMWQFDIV